MDDNHSPAGPQGQEPQSPYEQYTTDQKRRRRRALIALFVAIIVVVAALAYFMLVEREKTVTIYEISEIRELEVLEDVPFRYMTRDELRDMLSQSIDAGMIEEFEESQYVLDALFLLDYEENLTQIMLDSYGSQIAGFYDPQNKEIVVMEGASSVTDRVILAHELTHALQDQHFDLTEFQNVTDTDEYYARQAVYEGDATIVQFKYMLTLTASELEELWESSDDATGAADEIPYAVYQIMMFPYQYGFNFTLDLFYDNGWESINDLYSDPPVSTEQVMHPDKYRNREAPMTVRFDREPVDMTLVVNDTMGEFMIYIMLDHYISSTTASLAAEGWGGDRFYYYKNDTDFLLVFKIRWDTEQDAQEFNTTYTSWMTDLPSKYQPEISSDCLQMEVDQDVTTIFYSSDSQIIDQVRI